MHELQSIFHNVRHSDPKDLVEKSLPKFAVIHIGSTMLSLYAPCLTKHPRCTYLRCFLLLSKCSGLAIHVLVSTMSNKAILTVIIGAVSFCRQCSKFAAKWLFRRRRYCQPALLVTSLLFCYCSCRPVSASAFILF